MSVSLKRELDFQGLDGFVSVCFVLFFPGKGGGPGFSFSGSLPPGTCAPRPGEFFVRNLYRILRPFRLGRPSRRGETEANPYPFVFCRIKCGPANSFGHLRVLFGLNVFMHFYRESGAEVSKTRGK